MQKLRILILIEKGNMPPDTVAEADQDLTAPWKTEFDVYSHLHAMGHEVRKLEVHNELSVIREAIAEFKPQVAFNLMDAFGDIHIFDQHVVSFLELVNQPYTGCNPRGLTLTRDKALTKKIMAYHRIHVPKFTVLPRRRRIRRPRDLPFPLIVKSVNVEGSIGISKASLVHDDEHFEERVRFIHESLETYAIAEQYIEGRELYVGVVGNLRLATLPVWELVWDKAPEDMPRFATRRAKSDSGYQRKWGIATRHAEGLGRDFEQSLAHLCKRIYRIMGCSGYARMDFRMSADGQVYLLEANPNPQLGLGDEFAESAAHAGIGYDQLLTRIVKLGLSYEPQSLT
jgi:D-alanine-D-alanine ligase